MKINGPDIGLDSDDVVPRARVYFTWSTREKQ